MAEILGSIDREFRRYKKLAEGAFAQLEDADLSKGGATDNSIAVLVWHLSGNLKSRFTDFLTTDGEKPWRHRDEEFVARPVTRAELLQKWEEGWAVLFGALSALKDDDLSRTVTIRREPMAVHDALARSVTHASYHVGQIVYIAKSFAGARWNYMTIPPGKSEEYNNKK